MDQFRGVVGVLIAVETDTLMLACFLEFERM
jgi:hypothetical protein